jgi:molybdate transport system ATP-binding protein
VEWAVNRTQGGLHVDIQKRLGRFQLDVRFESAPGVTVLFGPSGAGKSSILASVAGALRPDAGTIRLGEGALFDERAGIDMPAERRGIGWVFQDARLFPHLSVEGNLRYGLKRAAKQCGAINGGAQYGGKEQGTSIGFEAVTTVLGLGTLLKRRPLTLSGGEAQRVAIGRALLSQPRLLLMDEPLASLDDFRKAEILAFIEQVRDAFGLPVIYVTHAKAEALRLASKIVAVDEGRVFADGAPEATMAAAAARLERPRP